MNEDFAPPAETEREPVTLGSSTLFKLIEKVIQLTERNDRQHRAFEKVLRDQREATQASFNSFAADTQRAYQQLRQEVHGEKRVAVSLLNELLDVTQEFEQICKSRPKTDAATQEQTLQSFNGWADSIEVQLRKMRAALQRHGVHPYDAVIGSQYNPALHERVGSCTKEGMGPLLVGEQVEQGLASQQPDFVLRRARVLVTS